MSKKIIKEQYDNSAAFYNFRYNNIQGDKYDVMSEYFPEIWRLALDVGCGTGLLNTKVSNLIGMDISLGMLEIAKKTGQKVVQAESENIPFKDEIFDVVFSFSVLQSSDNLNKSVKEIKRVLKPRGLFIMTYLDKKFNSSVVSTLKKYFKNVKQVPCGEDVGFICS